MPASRSLTFAHFGQQLGYLRLYSQRPEKLGVPELCKYPTYPKDLGKICCQQFFVDGLKNVYSY